MPAYADSRCVLNNTFYPASENKIRCVNQVVALQVSCMLCVYGYVRTVAVMIGLRDSGIKLAIDQI